MKLLQHQSKTFEFRRWIIFVLKLLQMNSKALNKIFFIIIFYMTCQDLSIVLFKNLIMISIKKSRL